MKRQHLFAFLLVFALIFAAFSLSVFAYDSESTALGEPVFHDDGFLTESERARVIRALTDAQEKSGVHFGALLYRTAYDGGAYHNRMKGEDSVLLIVWQENGVYRYELFTYGTANDEMTDREADAVLDADDVYQGRSSCRRHLRFCHARGGRGDPRSECGGEKDRTHGTVFRSSCAFLRIGCFGCGGVSV